MPDNLVRIIPENFFEKIYLNKIKIKPIFKWIKNKGVSDLEMIKTFNCGVGFCLVVNKKNIKNLNKFFKVEYKPYIIGKIIKNKKTKILFNEKIKW